jgi:hypothetical protein
MSFITRLFRREHETTVHGPVNKVINIGAVHGNVSVDDNGSSTTSSAASVAEDHLRNPPEALQKIGQALLAARPLEDLRRIDYELQAFLKLYPNNVDAQLLRDRTRRAIHREIEMLNARTKSDHGSIRANELRLPRRRSSLLWLWILMILLATVIFLFFRHINHPPNRSVQVGGSPLSGNGVDAISP